MSCHERNSLSPLSRQTIGSQLHRIFHYKRPNTAARAPAPAPSMGNAVATAPESVTALPAALEAELAAEFAFEVAAPTSPPALLVTELAALEALPGALVAVTSAGKTVVRVRVSVSSRSSPSSSISVEVVVKVLVIMDTEDEEVMVPLPELVAAPALKVVDEKPQELTTSSTSAMAFVNCGLRNGYFTAQLTILIVIVIAELANASSTLRQLGAGTIGVTDTVDFLTIATVGVVASASSVNHGLADRAALRRNIVVVELLCCDGADGSQAQEKKAVLVLHDCCS